jgi:hypothetical protein
LLAVAELENNFPAQSDNPYMVLAINSSSSLNRPTISKLNYFVRIGVNVNVKIINISILP